VFYSAIVRDITERQRAAEAIRQSEERFRLLIEGVKDYAIFMLDPAGRVSTWNAGAERIMGYSAAEIIGKHFSCFYPPEAVAQGWPEQALEIAWTQGWSEGEGWRLRKDGASFWANVVITALCDDSGRLRSCSKVTRDITERKETEQRVRKLNEELAVRIAEVEAANRELESFSCSISHDLRAPLRATGCFARILLNQFPSALPDEGMH
jgi:PAS domain S-box-containing protein